MQLGRNFFDAAIADLAPFEQVFYNTKYVFHLAANGRFQMFSFSGFPLTAFAELFQGGGAAHDLEFDLFSLLVANFGVGTLFSTNIATVAIDFFLVFV